MAILLDLDETLLRESDARNRAALDFLKQFSVERMKRSINFTNRSALIGMQSRHFLQSHRKRDWLYSSANSSSQWKPESWC
jgi:FMN phosphatase YigB (HAD superfamily)